MINSKNQIAGQALVISSHQFLAVLGILSFMLLVSFTLPLIIAEASAAVARQDLQFILWLRLTQSANVLTTAVYAFKFGGSLERFATIQLFITGLLSSLVLMAGKNKPRHIKYKTPEEIKKLIGFIKYTMVTLATTNLLKTAATFLIGAMMGPKAKASYAIPPKLTELFEFPLRSLGNTAFPQLASQYNLGKQLAFKQVKKYSSWSYLFYLPAIVIAFIFAPEIVLLLGGSKYIAMAAVLRLFIFVGLLLPANRLTGISLDALHLPNRNALKVIVMAVVNIVGDIVAIKLTHDLKWIAFVSVVNAAVGFWMGWLILKKTDAFEACNIFKEVFEYSHSFLKRCVDRITKHEAAAT